MTSPIVEEVLASLLKPIGVAVVTQIPTQRPARFVRVVAVGGPPISDLVLDLAEVAWEAYGSSQHDAAILARDVRDLIDAASGSRHAGAFITNSESTRPRWFPDEMSGLARYVGQASILIQL